MNTAVTTAKDKGSIMESVIIKGDVSKLTPEERSVYYMKVCESAGLNAMTQPFSYIVLNGKLTLYATKGATEQLRKVHNISLEIVSQKVENDILMVHVRAKDAAGRVDEDFGAVPLPDALKGDARINAMLKAITKAKRRATLSICGLGMLDETELETIPASAMQPVETEAPAKSVFKNAALRNAFTQNVLKSFDESISYEDLKARAAMDTDKRAAMRESGNEYDALALDEIQKRYTLMRDRFAAQQQMEQAQDSFGADFADAAQTGIEAVEPPEEQRAPGFMRKKTGAVA